MLPETQGGQYYPQYETIFDVNNPQSFYLDPDPVLLAFIAEIPTGRSVLELAAGDGRYTLPMLERGLRVTATDVKEEPLRILSQKSSRRGLQGLTTLSALSAFEPFPFADGAMDAVVCTGFLYLFPKDYIATMVGESARVLGEGGRFICDFVTDIKRTDTTGQPVVGRDEMKYTLSSGLQTMNEILIAHALQPRVLLNTLNQSFAGGTSIRGNKLNYSARKISQ